MNELSDLLYVQILIAGTYPAQSPDSTYLGTAEFTKAPQGSVGARSGWGSAGKCHLDFIANLTLLQNTKIQYRCFTDLSLIIQCYICFSMSIAVGALYIRKYFNENSKANALEMVNDIRQSTYQSLFTSDSLRLHTFAVLRTFESLCLLTKTALKYVE